MYRVTVRRGPKVEHSSEPTLEQALEAVQRHASRAPRRDTVEFISRRYEPGDLVAARIELKGSGVRAGLDVRGDGSTVAWTGRLRRAVIEPRPGEDAYAALRRTLVTA